MRNERYIVILGPTASGKSALAMQLARQHQGEIICCDSVQFYRGFDIGSAKPTPTDQSLVPHHLFDVVDAKQSYSAGTFRREARLKITEIQSRGGLPIVVGGTGLYYRALVGENWHELPSPDEKLRQRLSSWSTERLRRVLQRIDFNRAKDLHPNDRVRHLRAVELCVQTKKTFADLTLDNTPPDERAFTVVLDPERKTLHERIAKRAEWMLANGLAQEVEDLLAAGVEYEDKPMQSIGYAQVAAYLQNSIQQADLIEAITIATRQYAKRQCTWFRSVTANLRISVDLGEHQQMASAVFDVARAAGLS